MKKIIGGGGKEKYENGRRWNRKNKKRRKMNRRWRRRWG
jgi:hypothetical protein